MAAASALWLLSIGYVLRADLSIMRVARSWLASPCPEVAGQATISLDDVICPDRRLLVQLAAEIARQDFEARSSAGAVFALCRKLVAASIPDRPYEVINIAAPGTVSLRGPSIRAAAGLTVAERDRGGLTVERWTPPPTPRYGLAQACWRGAEPARVQEPVTA
jgi:hypothetical protein